VAETHRNEEQPGECPNCGAHLEGAYCHRCGQSTRGVDLTMGEVAHDFLGSLVSFDSRIWRTLYLLLFLPGELTTRYLGGQRARFVPPGRLYVFVSLLYFVFLAWAGGGADSLPGGEERLDAGATLSLITDVGDTVTVPDPLPIEGGVLLVPREETPAAEGGPGTDTPAVSGPVIDTLAVSGPVGSRPLVVTHQVDEVDLALDLPGFLQPFESGIREAWQDPSGFRRSYLRWMSYLMFLMVPIFAGIVHLAYLGRHRYFLHHLVFATHLHVVAFLVLGALGVLRVLPGFEERYVGGVDASAVVGNVAALVLAVHLFLGLRRVYGGRIWTTLLRSAFVGMAYLLVLAAGVAGVALLALLVQ